MELSKSAVNPQVVHRTPINVKKVVTPFPKGGYERYEYSFTVTLDNGTRHTYVGHGTSKSIATNVAVRRSEHMIEHGWSQEL